MEQNRFEYSEKLNEYRKKMNDPCISFPKYQIYFQYFVSAIVTIIAVFKFKIFHNKLFF